MKYSITKSFDDDGFIAILQDLLEKKNGKIGPLTDLIEELDNNNPEIFPTGLASNKQKLDFLREILRCFDGIVLKQGIGIVHSSYQVANPSLANEMNNYKAMIKLIGELNPTLSAVEVINLASNKEYTDKVLEILSSNNKS